MTRGKGLPRAYPKLDNLSDRPDPSWFLDNERVHDVRSKLANPETRSEALFMLGQWVLWTCDLFGASPVTSFKVAAEFVSGIERSWRNE